MDEQRVYGRDASWYRRPNTRSVKVVHWAAEKDGAMTGWSACGRIVLDTDFPRDPATISEGGRCQGPGCRQRWAAFLARSAA